LGSDSNEKFYPCNEKFYPRQLAKDTHDLTNVALNGLHVNATLAVVIGGVDVPVV
jgi:hypothetical protein